jgi:hypothetical protein
LEHRSELPKQKIPSLFHFLFFAPQFFKQKEKDFFVLVRRNGETPMGADLDYRSGKDCLKLLQNSERTSAFFFKMFSSKD